MIVDARGNPLRGAPRRPRRMGEIATIVGGRDITRGWVDAEWWLRPQDEVLLRQGAGDLRLYDDLLRDDRVFSVLEQRRRAVVAREWEVRPGGERRRDRQAADHLREQLEHVGWDAVTDRMLFGVLYGFSIAEAVYARDGARVALDRLPVRNRRRFVFGPDMRPRLLTASGSGQGERLPPRKFWCFTAGNDNSDDPYGRGLGHQLYWPVFFKRHQIKFWLTLLDRYGQPTPIGRYPRSQAHLKQDLLDAMRAIVTDGAAAFPDDMTVELLETARGGRVDYDAFREAMDRAITTVVLSQTMTTEDGASRSQAEVHLEVRDEVVESDARLVDDSFSRSLGRWLTEWNWPGAATPVVRRVMETPARQLKRALRDQAVAALGHRPTADYVEEAYGIPLDRSPAPPAGQGDGDAELAEDADEADAEAVLPKLAAFADRARERLDNADSLGGFRVRLEEDVRGISPDAAARALGGRLALAVLQGMSDADDGQGPEFADDDGRLDFRERVRFFRDKLSVPTLTWTDIWQEQHDVAFVVAGAARDDLLADLRAAVDRAVADGATLRAFRGDFDRIVARHGWAYRGGRDWRTRVIWETNRATSYAAGRWRQMQAVAGERPFWRYRHNPASIEPRIKHVAWDGLLLRHDDPWWQAHWPPNGWGCRCYVESVGRRQAERLGGVDEAPATAWTEERVGSGPTARVVRVADGVDAGFAHAPGRHAQLGAAVRRRLLQGLADPPAVRAAGLAEMRAWSATLAAALAAALREMRDRGEDPEATA